jgi:hypothetical protein
MHPYCEFCEKHFFSEDQFTLHLRDHFKCDLCTEAHGHRYYQAYQNLQVHFSISHYGCPEEKCVAEGFVAFKTMDELTHHRDKVHREANVQKGKKTKVGLSCTDFKFEGGGRMDGINENKIYDNEGKDMSKMLLSLQKTRSKVFRKESYDEKFDIREFLDNAANRGNLSVEQERLLLRKATEGGGQNFNNDRGSRGRGGRGRGGRGRGGRGQDGGNRNQYDDQYAPRDDREPEPAPASSGEESTVYLEDIHLAKLETMHDLSEKQFFNKLENVMKNDVVDKIDNFIHKYRKGAINGTKLFTEFETYMGKKLAFKYFPLYIKTVQSAKTAQELDNVLYEKAMNLPSKNNCVLFGNDTFSDLFKKITRYIADNIFYRIDKKLLDPKKPVHFYQSRIFQMIGTIRASSPKDMIKFAFLVNFTRESATKNHVYNMLFVDIKNINETLNLINNEDILICFLYFNLVASKLAGKYIKSDKEKINPNLLKTFLRHFPNFAKERKFDTESCDEDYEPPVGGKTNVEGILKVDVVKPVRKDSKPSPVVVVKGRGGPKGVSKEKAEKMTDVFVGKGDEQQGKEEAERLAKVDVKNVYEFPDLGLAPSQSKTNKQAADEEAEKAAKKIVNIYFFLLVISDRKSNKVRKDGVIVTCICIGIRKCRIKS